jgi:hypothetical protein
MNSQSLIALAVLDILRAACGLTQMQITLIKVKYVRIVVKTTTDTVYPYTLSTNQLKY